ncbi:TraR/DksA family transcriptional regulator [Salinisphaera hydrothermalis]|uniref:C4-type zinc finger protein, DksA/TraR family n=1 Tax=Salinisphaera hydrothermalis (strain C41B8) TaxID=1304275 RepID=A0A084IQT6_SALHC|nr:TraR/DksA family transcriptional regulator [Salinisphaera hydrothermalis]KEZ79070.1 C4-type zinc finger protein, DksA/TraR family [Salinisphaera hydrothermalis C41B8]
MTQPLAPEQLDRLQSDMRDRLVQLRAQVAHALEHSVHESHEFSAGEVLDMEDTAFVRMVRELDLADIERDAAEIHDIDAALARMDDGSYGQCVDCGEPIALARLEAYPSAKRCYACQQAVERAQGM